MVSIRNILFSKSPKVRGFKIYEFLIEPYAVGTSTRGSASHWLHSVQPVGPSHVSQLRCRTAKAAPMHISTLTRVATLQCLVGFLGEQGQYNWWPSAFFTPSSSAFLAPVFSKTAFTAQYQGVKAAASRVHDEHIGVGKVYHLFRLPETTEQALVNCVQDVAFVASVASHLNDSVSALERLATLAGSSDEHAEGPVLVGPIGELAHEPRLRRLAQYYHSAFTGNTRTYPYYVDRT